MDERGFGSGVTPTREPWNIDVLEWRSRLGPDGADQPDVRAQPLQVDVILSCLNRQVSNLMNS